MRLAGRILLVFLAAVVVLGFVAWSRAAAARRADATYHAAIPKTLLVTSAGFPADGDIPVPFTCRGTGLSPELSWKGAPSGVKSYALVVSDFDVPSPALPLAGFTHWVVYNIPASELSIRSAIGQPELHRSAIEVGTNSAGDRAYQPPCPPLGTHRYIFRIYALDVPQLRPAQDDGAAVLEAMRGHTIAYGELVGRAAR